MNKKNKISPRRLEILLQDDYRIDITVMDKRRIIEIWVDVDNGEYIGNSEFVIDFYFSDLDKKNIDEEFERQHRSRKGGLTPNLIKVKSIIDGYFRNKKIKNILKD